MYIEELHSLERVTHSVVNNDETNKPVTRRDVHLTTQQQRRWIP